MKQITIPKDCYYEHNVPKNRLLQVGLRVSRIWAERVGLIRLNNCDWRWGSILFVKGSQHHTHVSTLPCNHPDFKTKRCICVTIKDGVITDLNWHLPHQGDHSK